MRAIFHRGPADGQEFEARAPYPLVYYSESPADAIAQGASLSPNEPTELVEPLERYYIRPREPGDDEETWHYDWRPWLATTKLMVKLRTHGTVELARGVDRDGLAAMVATSEVVDEDGESYPVDGPADVLEVVEGNA